MLELALCVLIALAPQADTAAPAATTAPAPSPLLTPAPSPTFRVGEPLPALRLPDISGSTTVDLRDFRGRKLVLFEFASW